MPKQTINIGTSPNSGTGDPLRTAFTKVNENFTEVYNISQSAYNYANTIVSDTQIDPLARSTANAAFNAANNSSVLAQSAFNKANTVVYSHIELTERHDPTGNIVTFIRTANNNVSDIIDTGLALARSNNGQGLYNSAVEPNYNASVSPANTEWNWTGWHNLDNVKNRHYRTWREALRNKVGSNIVGAELVMHDLTNDKYYKVKFTNWDIGGVGGANGAFTYTRELIDTSTQVGVVFEDGTNQITASNSKDWPIVWLDNNNYTLRLIDANRTLRGYDMTLFVPRDSDVNFPIGTNIEIITETIGITVERVQHIEEVEAQIYGSGYGEARDSWNIPEYSFARLIKTDTNIWYIVIAGQADGGAAVDEVARNSANAAAQTVPQNAQSTNYTLQLTDAGKHIYYTQASDTTLYIPTTSNVAFSNGSTIMIISATSAGANVTVSPNTGVTMYLAGNTTSASRNVTTYGMATLIQVAANTWFINGTGVS